MLVLGGDVISRAFDPVEFTQAIINLNRAAGICDLKAFKSTPDGVQFAEN
jgi:hypothetical protein